MTIVFVIAAFAAAALYLGYVQKKREKREAADIFRKEFGKVPHKNMPLERQQTIDGYYRRHPSADALDGITCNDLEFLRLYDRIDSTQSSAGEEYLYRLLRVPQALEGGVLFPKNADETESIAEKHTPQALKKADALCPSSFINTESLSEQHSSKAKEKGAGGASSASADVDEPTSSLNPGNGERPVAGARCQEKCALSDEEITYWQDPAHEKERIDLLCALKDLGHTGRFSLYDYMDSLDSLEWKGSGRSVFVLLLYAVSVAVMFVSVQIGILLFLAALVIGLVHYFREKSRIEPYLISFRYLLRMMKQADLISTILLKADSEELRAQGKALAEVNAGFAGFRRGSGILMSSGDSSSNPLDLVLDYIRILFHLDLFKFSSMLSAVRQKKAEIDSEISIVGRADAAVAAASFRESLPEWCRPEFTVCGEAFIDAEDLYHPLLENAVPNSLHTDRPILLTGSNASGKSTFLRSVAICALLAQTIWTVPAKSWRSSLFRIYSSMALKDNLQGHESYYMVEIKSLKRILDAADVDATNETSERHNSFAAHEEEGKDEADKATGAANAGTTAGIITEKFSEAAAGDGSGMHSEAAAAAASVPVLAFIDEVLRGTNTIERIAASTEILHAFAANGILTFAATHDIELTDLLPEYDNYHFGEEIEEGDVIFHYHLQKGRATTRNAIRLLGQIGFAPSITEKAEERAAQFEKTGKWSL